MLKKWLYSSLAIVLVAVANLGVQPASLFTFYQPKTPKALQKF
ncbi:cyclic lactone autoinducer peptide [Thermanaerosceptrum fracticalcis]|nr:cyclic lactone autoinducer peptide [Thermanaerosceptrum fracticalcis]